VQDLAFGARAVRALLVPRVATATLGAGAGGGAPFNIIPLHIKNLILPTTRWVNQ